MALPPIDLNGDLEAEDELEPSEPTEGSEDDMDEDSAEGEASDLDPMFAADVQEAFPDLDDKQLAALQRAVLGLIAGGGLPPAGGAGF